METAHDTVDQAAGRAADEESALELCGLMKSYGTHRVLDGLDLRVERREVFGLLGRNGAGKTTTVEIAQGLRRADAGHVRVLGLDPIREMSLVRRQVGSQLQSSGLPDRMTVQEALRLFTRLAGDLQPWQELADDWDLARLARRRFATLSGGERQRLFLALALANRPRLLFLDELTQGLDPSARHQTWTLVRRLRDRGVTVVLITHHADEAEHGCDRVAVLHGGRIVARGTPQEVSRSTGLPVRTSYRADRPRTAELRGLPGVREVRHRGRTVEVLGDANSGLVVAAHLESSGDAASEFRVDPPSLTEAFDILTGEAP